ncbi:MAG: hypothetical protein COB37_11620 [Kordiimonadales bacterium]|nr:MAG: hypothetical protein COB37_11620 [Kordiimonadales bacterium]
MSGDTAPKVRLPAFLLKYAHYGVVLVFLVLIAVGYFIFTSTVNNVIDKTVVSNAQTVNATLNAFRTLYTREVVSVVRGEGIEVSHQFQNKAGVIPLPASLSMELGNMIASGPTGASVFLYSPYPFPWRDQGGLNDDFRKDAWAAINKDPSKPFFRVETYNGVSSVRYATADIMRQSCVSCHNTHPQSPKVDWKAGDVRGLLEVVQPVGTIKQSFAAQERDALLSFGALFLVVSIGIAGVFIAYRKRMEENRFLLVQLEKNNDTLHVANEELQQFAYRTSHDLKAPLLSIQGLSQYIADDLDDGDLDEVKLNVGKIDGLSKKLESTIDNILDLAKADYLVSASEELDIEGLIDGVFENLAVMAEQRGVVFTKSIGHDWACFSNEIRLRQVLENLISNGAKYACDRQEKSYVSVATKTTDDTFNLTVSDNGIGIPPDKLGSVFAMFTRFHPEKSTGSGLGLYLVKKHIDALGGEIEFESEDGTEFVIKLPRATKGVQ